MLEKLKTLRDSVSQTLKNILAAAEQDWKTIWNQGKAFFILFGAIILTIKFRQFLIDLIVNGSKALFKDAQKKSDKDQALETQANTEADKLVKEAKDLPAQEHSVDEDWNQK